MRGLFLRRGQNLVDLALIIGVIGLVVATMQVYIKRNIQGKVKDLTDYIVADGQSAGDAANQYSHSTFTLISRPESNEFVGGGRRFFDNAYVSLNEYDTGTITNNGS